MQNLLKTLIASQLREAVMHFHVLAPTRRSNSSATYTRGGNMIAAIPAKQSATFEVAPFCGLIPSIAQSQASATVK